MGKIINKSVVKQHIIYFSVICCFIAVMQIKNINCPIAALLGVPCPTCGVTRAMLSLFSLDFKGYMGYHPLALPLSASVVLLLHVKVIRKRFWIYIFVSAVLLLNTVRYIGVLMQYFPLTV